MTFQAGFFLASSNHLPTIRQETHKHTKKKQNIVARYCKKFYNILKFLAKADLKEIKEMMDMTILGEMI